MDESTMSDASVTHGELVGEGHGAGSSTSASQAAPSEESESNENEERENQETSVAEDRKMFIRARTLREMRLGLLQSYPIMWVGDLLLRRLKIRVAIKFIYGKIDLFQETVPPSEFAYPGIQLRNAQKFNGAVADLKRKAEDAKICVLIAVPMEVKQCIRLQKLTDYFIEKGNIGLSHFPVDGIPEKGLEFYRQKMENLRDMLPTASPLHKKKQTSNEIQNKRPSKIPIYKKMGIMKTKEISLKENSTMRTQDSTKEKKTSYEGPSGIPKSVQMIDEMKFFPPSDFVYENLLLIAPMFAKRIYADKYPHLLLVMHKINQLPLLEPITSQDGWNDEIILNM